jgi:23S rRNA pseudouridine1911/1915/1917 synthase
MELEHNVSTAEAGGRVDVWLTGHLADTSRARAQQWIREGHVLINDTPPKSSYLLRAEDRIRVRVPEPRPVGIEPENIPLHILFEDPHMLVLNKPAGLVVHPAAGHEAGTLVNALLHHCHDLAGIGGELRPGIVHRLDKDTSGVMVVAKTEAAMNALSHAFKARTVQKNYCALVKGVVQPEAGRIETLIGRDPHHRKRMSADVTAGRIAVSHYRVMEQFADASLLDVRIETGRTHQIRVHMAHIGHAIYGDQEYGKVRMLADGTPVERQMLHAARLMVPHPVTGVVLEFDAPLPDDMRRIIRLARVGMPKKSR